jgi:hypothetical protein
MKKIVPSLKGSLTLQTVNLMGMFILQGGDSRCDMPITTWLSAKSITLLFEMTLRLDSFISKTVS